MEVASFILYLFAFCYLIYIIPFFKIAGINSSQIISLFIIKILAGIAYAKFYSLPKYYPGSDTWRFYRLSLTETEWLKKDPLAFIKDLFIYGYNTSGNIFSGENSYWNDLKSNVIVKIMAAMNVITFKSYYTNIILFNFLFLIGLVALLKVLISLYPEKKYLLLISIFLMPSTLFWCSGVHKDGLILSAIGLLVYLFYKVLTNRLTTTNILITVLSLLLVFTLRNYVFFALLPAMLAWGLSEKFPRKQLLLFGGIYLTGVTLFFIFPLVFPSHNFLSFISSKQNEFLKLEGTSSVIVTELHPSFSSFISYLPNALDMAFLRPHINEIKNFSYIPAALEVLLLLFLALTSIVFSQAKELKPIALFLIFLSLSILIIAGYTVTFSGAIVRYRSIILPLLISSLVCITDFQSLKNRIMFFKRN